VKPWKLKNSSSLIKGRGVEIHALPPKLAKCPLIIVREYIKVSDTTFLLTVKAPVKPTLVNATFQPTAQR